MGYFSIPIERLFLVDFQNRRQYGYFPLVFRLTFFVVICRPTDSKEFALFLDGQFGVVSVYKGGSLPYTCRNFFLENRSPP